MFDPEPLGSVRLALFTRLAPSPALPSFLSFTRPLAFSLGSCGKLIGSPQLVPFGLFARALVDVSPWSPFSWMIAPLHPSHPGPLDCLGPWPLNSRECESRFGPAKRMSFRLTPQHLATWVRVRNMSRNPRASRRRVSP